MINRFNSTVCVSYYSVVLVSFCIISACKYTKIFQARHFFHVSTKTLFYFWTFCCAYSEPALKLEFSLKAPSVSIISQRCNDFYSIVAIIIIIITTDERHCLVFDKYQRAGLFSVITAELHTFYTATLHTKHIKPSRLFSLRGVFVLFW